MRSAIEAKNPTTDVLSEVITLDDIKSILSDSLSVYYETVSDLDKKLEDTNNMLKQRGFFDLEKLGTLVNGIPVDIEISVCFFKIILLHYYYYYYYYYYY